MSTAVEKTRAAGKTRMGGKKRNVVVGRARDESERGKVSEKSSSLLSECESTLWYVFTCVDVIRSNSYINNINVTFTLRQRTIFSLGQRHKYP